MKLIHHKKRTFKLEWGENNNFSKEFAKFFVKTIQSRLNHRFRKVDELIQKKGLQLKIYGVGGSILLVKFANRVHGIKKVENHCSKPTSIHTIPYQFFGKPNSSALYFAQQRLLGGTRARIFFSN